MKTLFFMIALFLCINCIAQIKPIFEFTGGYKELRSLIMVNQSPNLRISSDIWKAPIYTSIVLGATWKNFYLKQYVDNYFGISGSPLFDPKQITYATNIYYQYKSWEFGYEHMCSHPIIATTKHIVYYAYLESYDKIYIKIKIL